MCSSSLDLKQADFLNITMEYKTYLKASCNGVDKVDAHKDHGGLRPVGTNSFLSGIYALFFRYQWSSVLGFPLVVAFVGTAIL